MKDSMTALVAEFARGYHSEQVDCIAQDEVAKRLISEEKYQGIAMRMKHGISYFNESFKGSDEEALLWIVNHELLPTPLGRVVFTERALKNAIMLGAKQYIILAAGYDTFAYRQPEWARNIEIFEIDQIEVSRNKRKRLENAKIEIPSNVHFIEADFTEEKWEERLVKHKSFNRDCVSFVSMLGLSYYLDKETLHKLIEKLSKNLNPYSSFIFDYPNEEYINVKKTNRKAELAKTAGEEMQAVYSYQEIEQMLMNEDFLIYEHMVGEEITKQFFDEYNRKHIGFEIKAPDSVEYCLAVLPKK